MKLRLGRIRNVSFFQVALYIFLMALFLKGMILWDSTLPARDELIFVRGIVRTARLGGDGSATYLKVEAEGRTRKYSTYHGKVWSGMEMLAEGDVVEMLAEKKKLQWRGERDTYWIWDFSADGQKIIEYEEMFIFRQQAGKNQNRFADIVVVVSASLFCIAFIRKLMNPPKKPVTNPDAAEISK